MQENLLVTLKVMSNSFTRKEKAIASYVLTHAEDVPRMSIAHLAEACHVGETSVFRLCRLLGKSGYQDFKMSLAHSLGQFVASPKLSDSSVREQDSTKEVMQKVYNNCASLLQDTYLLLDAKAMMTATRWMVKAKHICFFGVGSTSAMAQDLKHRFLYVTPKAEYVADPHLQTLRASSMTAGDVGIFFCYHDATMLPIARAAKEAGVKIILITSSSSSPVADIADLLFQCAANEEPCQLKFRNDRISAAFLAEMLFTCYCMADNENSTNRVNFAVRIFRDEI
jgi:DNA-binding MurR/RpiR family transcriptional regulator